MCHQNVPGLSSHSNHKFWIIHFELARNWFCKSDRFTHAVFLKFKKRKTNKLQFMLVGLQLWLCKWDFQCAKSNSHIHQWSRKSAFSVLTCIILQSDTLIHLSVGTSAEAHRAGGMLWKWDLPFVNTHAADLALCSGIISQPIAWNALSSLIGHPKLPAVFHAQTYGTVHRLPGHRKMPQKLFARHTWCHRVAR